MNFECIKKSNMNISFRTGSVQDFEKVKLLAIKAWSQFKPELTSENWQLLNNSLHNNNTYQELFSTAQCFVCLAEEDKIIGMSFLVSSGHPTEIYDSGWSYIRFVTVDPDYAGMGIGKKLTQLCIEAAKKNNEKVIALHTSEMMNSARHIYEQAGFTRVKELEQRFGKQYWLYKLDL